MRIQQLIEAFRYGQEANRQGSRQIRGQTRCVAGSLDGIREIKAGGGKRTKINAKSYVVRVRIKSGLSQAKFAAALGVSKRTLEQWEQGRRKPSGAAKQLLKIAERHPEVLVEGGANGMRSSRTGRLSR